MINPPSLADPPSSETMKLKDRLAIIKKNANFLQQSYHVRDGVVLHCFV